MKIIRFVVGDAPLPSFGVVIGDHAVAFSVLYGKAGTEHAELADSRAYLSGLPVSGKRPGAPVTGR